MKYFLLVKNSGVESWACAFGAFIFFGLALYPTKRVETRYECAIDDTTYFIEIMENYDIVEQRGDLWILEDKIDE